MSGRKVVVTGGSGFLGSNLSKELTRLGFQVVVYDLARPEDDKADYVQGDICDEKTLQVAMKDASAVIHTVAFGMAGNGNLCIGDEVTRKVNVEGTKAVVKACKQCGVDVLVFSSTLNIGFIGEEIQNATEDDIEQMVWDNRGVYLDEYSRTKHQAEHIVLGDRQIKACVLRLGGLFGPNERLGLPRGIKLINSGLLSWLGPREDVVTDFLYIDNAVQAHVKALNLLLDRDQFVRINGQVLNITDGLPMTPHSYVDPLHRALCNNQPLRSKTIPAAFITTFARSYEIFAFLTSKLTGRVLAFPFWGLTPMEAHKITVTNYVSIEKSRRLLGYEPVVERERQWSETLASYGLKLEPNKNNIERHSSTESPSAAWRVWLPFAAVAAIAVYENLKKT